MLIKEIMQKKLVTLSPESSIRDAAKKMKDYKVGYLLVTNGESLKGCVTDRDLLICIASGKDPDTTKIGTIMQTGIFTVTPETDVFDANRLMARKNVRRLPVVENGRVAGIVSTSDIASVLEEEVDNFLHVEEAYQL